ncbi:hypothetical protein [Thioclava kandeliae]|uniref:DUF2946 domain-containing protein n=1 Tax=Thioclava kandeliae TaxID=3070818 RepID=A0ABV1SLC1_9RHOB
MGTMLRFLRPVLVMTLVLWSVFGPGASFASMIQPADRCCTVTAQHGHHHDSHTHSASCMMDCLLSQAAQDESAPLAFRPLAREMNISGFRLDLASRNVAPPLRPPRS